MDKESERAVVILLAVHIISKMTDFAKRVVPALEDAGARLYDAVHDDSGHSQDLPGKQLTRQAVLTLATNAGFPDPKLAAAIAMAESGGVTNALKRSSREISVGLWQINTMVHPYTPEEMRDPLKNVQAAYKLFQKRGWQPWGAYTDGRYREFRTGILAP